jgi:SAM-dependent methyltransferase
VREPEEIRLRYARRNYRNQHLYSPLLPHVYLGMQEKERSIIRLINSHSLQPIDSKRVLEIGCGSGNNLLDLIRIGFNPENLVGNELLEERINLARNRLPAAIKLILGDAAEIDIGSGPFDIVFQSTVFTSLLDNEFQQKLADRMWALVKPGGAVLWYDFICNNPSNPDVRGVPLKRIRELFPKGQFTVGRVTLAPPISRKVSRIHPSFYTWDTPF